MRLAAAKRYWFTRSREEDASASLSLREQLLCLLFFAPSRLRVKNAASPHPRQRR
jgi:hypothetical protein